MEVSSQQNIDLLQILFNRYGKMQLRPNETAEVTGRSTTSLQRDRMDGVGIDYVKVGKGTNAKVFYPIASIVQFLESNTIQTA